MAGAARCWLFKPVFLNKVDWSVPFGIIQTCRQICSSFKYIIFNLLERLHDGLWNYYCAQLKCRAPQRSPINPNLMCIWSPFGRGNRPRAEETACVRAQKKALSSYQGPSRLLHPLSSLSPQDSSRYNHILWPTWLLSPSYWPSWLILHSAEKAIAGVQTSSPNESLLCKDYKERKAMETLQV